MSGILYVIPTPIGHLDDISRRAVDCIQEVDLLLCEDSRVTGRLLSHLEVKAAMKPYHAHNEHRTTEHIIELLRAGNKIGLVSDAGMPGLSDPGYLLIKEARRHDLTVVVLPGANAVLTALVGSGLPTSRYYFEGFLPHKKGRQKRWQSLTQLDVTIVLYESPHRIIKCLEEIKEHMGADRVVCVARELTKMHEEYLRGSASEVLTTLRERPSIKGEIVVVIAPPAYE